MSSLAGVTDQYGGRGSQHNAQFYVRPEDGRVLFFPHDLDFYSSSTMALIGNSELSRMLTHPPWERTFYGHLLDRTRNGFITEHLAPWCDQLGALLPAQNFAAHCAFMDARAARVQDGSSQSIQTTYPEVDFAITTNGGEDFTVSSASVTLQGTGWVDVVHIHRDTDPASLTVTWQVEVPLSEGDNGVDLTATDQWGAVVGSDGLTITRD